MDGDADDDDCLNPENVGCEDGFTWLPLFGRRTESLIINHK
jgi:hypothetical protein